MAGVIVATYNTRPQAELARARLEAEGIRAAVLGDDAGGLYPNLSPGGVRVAVASEDEAAALEILGEPVEPDPPGV